MRRSLLLLTFFSLIFVFLNSSAAQTITPVNPGPAGSCYQVMTDRDWFEESEVFPVYAAPKRTGCKPEAVPIVKVGGATMAVFTATSTDLTRREQIGLISGLQRGQYRAGDRSFVVGNYTGAEHQNYVRPGWMIRDGNLYFRALINSLLVYHMVSGRLYQVRENGEFLSVQVGLVSVSPLMVAWGVATEDELKACPAILSDPPCVKAQLPVGFDLSRPIFWSFDGGNGVATDGKVFDPRDSSLRSDTSGAVSAGTGQTGQASETRSRRVPPPPRP